MLGHRWLARASYIGFATIVLSVAAPGMGVRADDPPVGAEDLRPGLVVIYRDAAKPTPAEFAQLEPTIALRWGGNETAHPRLAPSEGTARWEGYVNIVRTGAYRFSARLRGKVWVRVGHKEVLAAEVHDAAPVPTQGPETRLEAGIYPLIAEYTRLPGLARLEVTWQAPFFPEEPLAREYLGHLPAKVPASVSANRLRERGRLLAEERSCLRCHQPDANDRMARGLIWRQGPDLSQVGGRAHPGWIYQWLASPHQMRPGSVMPDMFRDDDVGRVERILVTHYLASLGGPMKPAAKSPNPKDLRKSVTNGERLFTSTGCVTCHGKMASTDPPAAPSRSFYDLGSSFGSRASLPLTGLGNKTTPEKLAAYLQNPLAVDRAGRMPHMLLDGKEAQDLARFLCQDSEHPVETGLPPVPAAPEILEAFRRVEPRPEEVPPFQRLQVDKQVVELGKRLAIAKACNQCHTIAPGGKDFAAVIATASFEDIRKPDSQTKGCLAEKRSKDSPGPWFLLEDGERKALSAFLTEASRGAGSPAPAHAVRVTLQRFNCLACHQRDGEGGLTPEVVEELRKFEKADPEAVNPPPLTGVAHKLRTQWLKQVLVHAGRARPWMGLRMPQFGEANVGRLPEGLAALEGTETDDAVHKVPLTAAKLEAGRALIGKKAFGCISCHDIAGIANTGTRGPDLALMDQRVRYPWYRRWLEQAQRMQPGTRMPTVFPDGKSILPDILGGSAEAQADAMWAYLSLGPTLPLPEGLEPPKGLVVQVTDRPVVLRTFMPEAGSRGVAVGYPGGVSLAFDAATCRLAYAWSGNFLDATPVWGGRGGNPAKLLGARFWTAPVGCPLAVTVSEGVPDFAARAKDPAFGGAMPEGKLYEGPHQLMFEGYSPGRDGMPTFRYRINAQDLQPVEVQERPEPLQSPVGVGIGRRFTLHAGPQQKTWLWVAECPGEPRLLNAPGSAGKLDLKAEPIEIPVQGNLLVLPQGGDKVMILTVVTAPEGSRWHLARRGNGWQVLLRVPPTAQASVLQIGYNIWVPYRDDPELIKEFVPKKR
jgi:cytochrome c553